MKGNLFTNIFKEKPNQPDYRGTIVINDKEWQLAGWHNEDKNGNPYIGLKVSEPYKKPNIPQEAPKPIFPDDMDSVDDDLPF
jgi:uncharacterized protein (DUF736 family)